MPVSSLFKFLKGERVDIVDYAVDCHKKTGRPPRLAVNASSWWYTNMTAASVQAVRARTGVQAGVQTNLIERNILFYTLHILQLGIHLHFVFDGPKRPSNGGKLYPGHDAPSLLFQETLTHIGVPWHKAPAEAEAECAKMEMEEFVDGVWSEDGDALAFGCQTLIKFHFKIKSSTENREDTRKSSTHFKVYRLDDLARQYPGMDRQGFILYAILNGRPNDVRELHNLTLQDLLNAAGHGLGRSLCAASGSGENLRQWATTDFAGYLKEDGRNLKIPPKFPKWEHVQDYINPVTSTAEVFLDLLQPRDPFLDEKALFSFLVEKFQWSLNQWVKYVVPLRIVRSLLATEEGKESQHAYLKLDYDLKKSPQKVKATFLLSKATSLDVSELYKPNGELETLLWIIRKANFNEQRSITSYMTTPKSDQKGKAIASGSAPGKLFQRFENGADRLPLTPPSGSASSSNGESPSKTRERPRRQSTPPSPTPAPKKRNLPWPTGASIPKNIRPGPNNDRGTSVQTKESRPGKAKEIVNPPTANTKRARSLAGSNGSDKEELCGKRPRLIAEQLPSTPPAQITKPADPVNDFIIIDSDSDVDGYDERPKLAAEQLPSTLPAQITKPVDPAHGFIMIDSDEDEDGYGSFPSVADLPPVPEDIAPEIMRDDGLVNESSGDEYGSFPASPDLRALT